MLDNFQPPWLLKKASIIRGRSPKYFIVSAVCKMFPNALQTKRHTWTNIIVLINTSNIYNSSPHVIHTKKVEKDKMATAEQQTAIPPYTNPDDKMGRLENKRREEDTNDLIIFKSVEKNTNFWCIYFLEIITYLLMDEDCTFTNYHNWNALFVILNPIEWITLQDCSNILSFRTLFLIHYCMMLYCVRCTFCGVELRVFSVELTVLPAARHQPNDQRART